METKEGIKNNIKYPEAAKHLKIEGKVTTSFTVDNNGKVEVTKIKGHPSFLSSTREQLENLDLNLLHCEDEITMKFDFKIL